jgi:hypothetical protein
MCTPASSDNIILGTVLGSLFLFDLKNIESNPSACYDYNYNAMLEALIPNFNELEESKKHQKIHRAMIKYSVMSHSYLTDGLENYSHQSPIIKLAFISKTLSGIAQIGCLDEYGIVSVWSVVEIMGHHGTDYDLNMNLGGKYKIVLNYS